PAREGALIPSQNGRNHLIPSELILVVDFAHPPSFNSLLFSVLCYSSQVPAAGPYSTTDGRRERRLPSFRPAAAVAVLFVFNPLVVNDKVRLDLVYFHPILFFFHPIFVNDLFFFHPIFVNEKI
ncbi:hypothetical protein LINPERHAP1_LOCUS14377, partial [Linum perenne]